jgi:hypothetical protein
MQLGTDKRIMQEAGSALIAAQSLSGTVSMTREELANIVSLFASSDGWMDKVRLRADRRWYERLYLGPDHDIWVISWLPGQSTGFHDHGASSGAFVVATGILEEHCPGERTRVIHPGTPRAFGPDYTHDVRNLSLAPVISIHEYSPPLSDMNEYKLDGSRLVPREREPGKAGTGDPEWRVQYIGKTKIPSAKRILNPSAVYKRREGGWVTGQERSVPNHGHMEGEGSPGVKVY